MAFFNYSTMQMTAKIVYYGPGLCGKTTNLQYIYGHTVDNSRGEMVSLETQTDRTLFFDLLPMEVGTVAGFKTRVQLYTVPGQVFYNTTRKLVLKGVDGVVFVADSQRPMKHTNVESLGNLEENLAELGLNLENTPLVLQYNKQDLPDTLSFEELEESLNRGGWESHKASALTGEGVFETLRGISRLTLISLRKQLEASPGQQQNIGAAIQPSPPLAAEPEAPGPGTVTPETTAPPSPEPAVGDSADASAVPKPEFETQRHRRDYLLRLPAEDFRRLRRVALALQIEDDLGKVIRESRSVHLDIEDPESLAEILFQFNLALRAED
jgi:signal recognition particle receptor subunit beta